MKKLVLGILTLLLAAQLAGCGGKLQASERAISSDVIYEETISPNEDYVENQADRVYYTVTVYRTEDGVEVASSSNSAFSEDVDYQVQTDEPITKDDVQVQWQTLMGSTSATEDDELAVAEVTISAKGEVISQQRISFFGKGIDMVVDAVD